MWALLFKCYAKGANGSTKSPRNVLAELFRVGSTERTISHFEDSNVLQSISIFGENAPPVCLFVENPNGLVSLWDIMEGFDGALDFRRFLESLYELTEYEGELRIKMAQADDFPRPRIGVADSDYVRCHAKRLAKQMLSLGCEGTANALLELAKHAQINRSYDDLARALHGLPRRIVSDVKIIKFIHIPAPRRQYFQNADTLFGAQVLDKFPSTEFDIGECGRCFAFGRYTASVFHAMRVVEPGLRALAGSLGIHLVNPEWGQYVNRIQTRIDEIDKLGGNSGMVGWKEKQSFYSESVLDLKYIKNAWRNHVMHGKESYDDQRAQKIIEHTKGFMLHLSTRLSELPEEVTS